MNKAASFECNEKQNASDSVIESTHSAVGASALGDAGIYLPSTAVDRAWNHVDTKVLFLHLRLCYIFLRVVQTIKVI